MDGIGMVKKTILIFGCIIFAILASPEHYANILNAAAEVDDNVITFLNNLEDAVDKMDTYQVVKESENWKGKKHEKKVSMFRFKKPNLMRTDVLEGKKKGSIVLLNKEGKIRGKNRIGFKKTLKPMDKRLRNIRGYTFMNSSFSDKIKRLKDHIIERGCKAILTEEDYMGINACHLHIDHEDADDAVTDEDIWFDIETYAILKNLKYENGQKVTDITWRDFKINIPLDDGLFVQ